MNRFAGNEQLPRGSSHVANDAIERFSDLSIGQQAMTVTSDVLSNLYRLGMMFVMSIFFSVDEKIIFLCSCLSKKKKERKGSGNFEIIR